MERRFRGEQFLPEPEDIEAEEEEVLDPHWALHKYMANLELTPADLGSGKILDIGGGYGHFAKDAIEQGLVKKGDMITVDPDYANDGFVGGILAAKAEGEAIPFRDETFSLIISHAAAPNAFSKYGYEMKTPELAEKLEHILQDWLRTLKPGGLIKFYPIAVPDQERRDSSGIKNKRYKEALNIVLRGLEDAGCEIVWKEMEYEDAGDGVMQKIYLVTIHKPLEAAKSAI